MARKRGMQFIPYDYEAAYNKAMEDMHEWFIENLFQHRKKVIYALKEIRHRITTLHKSRLRVRRIVHPVSLQS